MYNNFVNSNIDTNQANIYIQSSNNNDKANEGASSNHIIFNNLNNDYSVSTNKMVNNFLEEKKKDLEAL